MTEPPDVHAVAAELVSSHGWRYGIVVKDATAAAGAWLWYSGTTSGTALSRDAAIRALLRQPQRKAPA